MHDHSRYLDYAATTPLDPRVLEAMLPFLREHSGNAHSIHGAGRFAREAVERAREQVAQILGADDPMQVVFTSGATESNNWVLSAHPTLAISPFEHSSVRDPALARGATVLKNLGTAIEPSEEPVVLVSVMALNNETGTRFDPAAARGRAKAVHSDLTQLLGKAPVDLEGIDFASVSAHKVYGPKGVGALWFRESPPEPLLRGGDQEHGARSGTLNVPGIVGFGAACALAMEEWERDREQAVACRAAFLEALRPTDDEVLLGGTQTVPHILSIGFAGLQGETLVIEMDQAGFAISSGAACSSRSTEPSHVLEALQVEERIPRGAVRVGFGRYSSEDVSFEAGKTLRWIAENLRTMH